MSTTGRTIQEILAIRKRARQLWVQERALAVLNTRHEIEQLEYRFLDAADARAMLGKRENAKRVAEEALALVQREIDAQQGCGEVVKYDAASPLQLRLYAAVLMYDNPELAAEEALDQARADEQERFDEYFARVHGEDEDDEYLDNENDEV